MNGKELKRHAASLMSTHNRNLRNYGIAYREIAKMYDHYSGFCLSDEMLLSDLAKEYIKEQHSHLEVVKKDTDIIVAKINAASKLTISDFLTLEETLEILRSCKVQKNDDRHTAVSKIENHYQYKKIRPKIFLKAFTMIEQE